MALSNVMVETLTQTHPQAYRVDANQPMAGTETVTIPATGIITPVIRFRVPRKAQWLIDILPLLIMKLKNSSGTELPRTAKIHLGFKHPVDSAPIWVVDVSYAPWSNVSLTSQYDVNYQDLLRLPLRKGYALDEDTEIWFGVSIGSGSSFTLSWAHSDFIFDIKQVLK